MYNYRIFEFGNIYCSGEISGSGASFQLFLPSSTILEMDVKDKKNKNVTKKKIVVLMLILFLLKK